MLVAEHDTFGIYAMREALPPITSEIINEPELVQIIKACESGSKKRRKVVPGAFGRGRRTKAHNQAMIKWSALCANTITDGGKTKSPGRGDMVTPKISSFSTPKTGKTGNGFLGSAWPRPNMSLLPGPSTIQQNRNPRHPIKCFIFRHVN